MPDNELKTLRVTNESRGGRREVEAFLEIWGREILRMEMTPLENHPLDIDLLLRSLPYEEPERLVVLYETNPTYPKLFGYLERRARYGALLTDFTRIRAGSITRSNCDIFCFCRRVTRKTKTSAGRSCSSCMGQGSAARIWPRLRFTDPLKLLSRKRISLSFSYPPNVRPAPVGMMKHCSLSWMRFNKNTASTRIGSILPA